MPRLTRQEKEMLVTAANLMLAGEWPLENDSDRQYERNKKALESAVEKLKVASPPAGEGT